MIMSATYNDIETEEKNLHLMMEEQRSVSFSWLVGQNCLVFAELNYIVPDTFT